MNLSPEQIQAVEDNAKLLFAPKEIAIIIGLNIDSFLIELSNENSSAYKAFHTGRLITEATYRKTVIEQASSGSPQAQKELYNLIELNVFKRSQE